MTLDHNYSSLLSKALADTPDTGGMRGATCNHTLPVLSHQTLHRTLFTVNRYLDSHPTSEVQFLEMEFWEGLSCQTNRLWDDVMFSTEKALSVTWILGLLFSAPAAVFSHLANKCVTWRQHNTNIKVGKEPQKQKMSSLLTNNVLNSSKLLNQWD